MRESGLVARSEPELRKRFADVPGFAFSLAGGFGEGSGVAARPIAFTFNGTGSFEELDQVTKDAMAAIADVPGLVDLDRTFQSGKPELHIQVDRQRASRVGLSTASVGTTVRTLLNGQTVSRYRESGREADIVVRLRPEDRARLDDILSLSILTTAGQMVPLCNVATLFQHRSYVHPACQSTTPGRDRRNYFGRTQNAMYMSGSHKSIQIAARRYDRSGRPNPANQRIF
jgi:multidrug efflux pump subunit AcrB